MSKFIFNIPMISSYLSKPALRPISTKKAKLFLGNTFYPRVANIYRNITEAIAKDNWTYLAAAFDPELYKQVTKQISRIKTNNFKIKMVQGMGSSNIKRRRKFMFRQRQWQDQYSKVAVQCTVIFGQQWGKKQELQNPKKDKEKGKNSKQKNKQAQVQLEQEPNRLIKIGSYRMLSYNPNVSVIKNLSNFYNLQTYEFRVRIKSTIHLQVLGVQNEVVSTSLSQSQNSFKQKEVSTEIILRSGSQSFNWVIVSINGIGRTVN